MKFLCVPCDEPMQLMESGPPDELGSLTVLFRCSHCGHGMAMLTNASETQLVRALGVRIGPGPSAAPAGPLEHVRTELAQVRPDAVQPEGEETEPVWTPAALERLKAAPRFVQPMIRQAYVDYARQHGLQEITPEVMDVARQALGMG
ncbi:MAG: PCP reductase family protein [Anaerolineae bacterium]